MSASINYPVEAHNIVIMGKPAKWQRSWTIHPLVHGDYSLLIYPKGFKERNFITRADINFKGENIAPHRHVFIIPKPLRQFKKWEWSLIKWSNTATLSLEKKHPPLSSLIFSSRATVKGTFNIKDIVRPKPHRFIVWSCNQPFDTGEEGEPTLNPVVPSVFDWYQKQVERFQPDVIWGLGDTAYSDGCDATNFIDKYYDHTQSLQLEQGKLDLTYDYRNMYLKHWSFKNLQKSMRNYPHYCIWDDHEIRDGWGSEANDFEKGNDVIQLIASKVANEYILNNGPRVREYYKNNSDKQSDAHQAYIEGEIASFIFDGRSSRKYADTGGQVISNEQMDDFKQFCNVVAKDKNIKYLVMGSAIPFINLHGFLENLISKTPKVVTDRIAGIRDDVRDSWHSPGNINQLKQLISVLRWLHRQHATLEIINVSGDIHVSNMFSFQPLGFTKALYQVTSSALSNREHPNDTLNDIIQIGSTAWSEALGLVSRIWPTISDPNIILLKPKGTYLEVSLKIYDLDAEKKTLDSAKDLVYEVGKDRF